MRVWEISTPGPMDSRPLRPSERTVPRPGPRQVLIKVSVCGVCRTDLHLAEGDLAPRQPATVPGHEVVGRVASVGPACTRITEGQRVGIAWLARSCGVCRYCRRGAENLCVAPLFTGWDLDGGFAEYAVAEEDFV